MEEELKKESINDNEGKKGFKNFLHKAGDTLKNAAKFAEGKIVEGVETVKKNIDDYQKQKEIEKGLESLFNNGTVKLTLVFPDNKNKTIHVNAKIDYDKKTITIYGENNLLTNKCFFIDELNQKYCISLIRLNQTVNLELNSVVYQKSTTVIEFVLNNDDATKEEMKTIINNQITIENSVIKKSNIG